MMPLTISCRIFSTRATAQPTKWFRLRGRASRILPKEVRPQLLRAETEIKLTNVEKASLEELLVDYEDYLRVRGKPQWTPEHPRFERMRHYASSDRIGYEYTKLLPKLTDEELANLCITLINQATYMLRHLIDKQQKQFLQNGGVREQMTKARLKWRKENGG